MIWSPLDQPINFCARTFQPFPWQFIKIRDFKFHFLDLITQVKSTEMAHQLHSYCWISTFPYVFEKRQIILYLNMFCLNSYFLSQVKVKSFINLVKLKDDQAPHWICCAIAISNCFLHPLSKKIHWQWHWQIVFQLIFSPDHPFIKTCYLRPNLLAAEIQTTKWPNCSSAKKLKKESWVMDFFFNPF